MRTYALSVSLHPFPESVSDSLPQVCSVFAGECLGPWSNGRFQAPLHYVNEQPQLTAAAEAGWTENSGCTEKEGENDPGHQVRNAVRHSWPFFLRSPGHAIISPSSVPTQIKANGTSGVTSSASASGMAIGTAAFVESEVFGKRAWRRPRNSDGQRPEY